MLKGEPHRRRLGKVFKAELYQPGLLCRLRSSLLLCLQGHGYLIRAWGESDLICFFNRLPDALRRRFSLLALATKNRDLLVKFNVY